jgi:ribosomal protein S18 acetylase RimI-like enzyme
MGGVQALTRARRFYEKAGFRWVSDFYAYEMNNHDMILTLG